MGAVATGADLPVRTTVAAAAVATGALAPDHTLHAEAGAIPTTTERAQSRAGPINDLCTISDQMRIVNLRERKSTTTRVIRSAIQVEHSIIRCRPGQACNEESVRITSVRMWTCVVLLRPYQSDLITLYNL